MKVEFGDPDVLRGLWAVAALALLCAILYRRRRAALAAMFPGESLMRLAPGARPGRRLVRLVLWLTGIASLTVSLARPQWGFRWEQSVSRGLDILILLDASRSMLAADFKPNRLQQAKWAIREFVRSLRGDRVALIPFAGTAFLLCPLTSDYSAFFMTLEDAHPNLLPRPGTSIAAALKTAVDAFDKQGTADGVILLLTDGEDHEGNIESWIPALKERNLRVVAVGVGGTEGEPIPAADGAPGFHKDRQGNTVVTSLKEEPLRRLVEETGGRYIRAAPGDWGLDRLLEDFLAPLERTEGESRLHKIPEEQAGWFIGAALLLIACESLLGESRRGRQAS